MDWGELSFSLPYFVSLGLALTLVLYGAQRSHVPVAGPLAVYALLQSVWIFGFLQESLALSLESKILWDNLQFTPFLLLPMFMLLTSRGFLGKPILPLHWGYWVYLVFVAGLLVVIYADSTLRWVRPDAHVLDAVPHGALTYTFTPLMYLMVAMIYAMTGLVFYRLGRHAMDSAGKHRRQGFLILTGMAVPTLAGLLTTAGLSFGPHRDITPLTFGIGDLIIVLGILRYRILDLVPMAFETAFQAISDPIVVVDDQKTIVAHNQAYAEFCGSGDTNLVGHRRDPEELNTATLAGYDLVRIPMTVSGTRERGVIWHFRDVRALRQSQMQQLETERLDALGRMANNLAHELNTPLASLLSATRFLQEKLPRLAAGEPGTLAATLASWVRVPDDRSSSERSRDRKLWQTILQAEGIDAPTQWADRLSGAGIVPRGAPADPGWGQSATVAQTLERACDLASGLLSLWVVEASSERASQIVAALQGLEHPAVPGVPERVSLRVLIDAALVGLGHRVNDGTVSMVLEGQEFLRGNGPRLTQMLFQLLRNAHQAAGTTGSIVVRSQTLGGRLVVEVEDDGPGIPEDQQKWIFSPYFTTRKAGEGSGLGLEIVKLVAKEHNAELGFESRPGRTVFRVAFPMVE